MARAHQQTVIEMESDGEYSAPFKLIARRGKRAIEMTRYFFDHTELKELMACIQLAITVYDAEVAEERYHDEREADLASYAAEPALPNGELI